MEDKEKQEKERTLGQQFGDQLRQKLSDEDREELERQLLGEEKQEKNEEE